jgi:hypothetical protein
MSAVQIRVSCIPGKVFAGKDLNMRAGLQSNRDEELPGCQFARVGFALTVLKVLERVSRRLRIGAGGRLEMLGSEWMECPAPRRD